MVRHGIFTMVIFYLAPLSYDSTLQLSDLKITIVIIPQGTIVFFKTFIRTIIIFLHFN